jgi:hypothetical protein
MSEELETEIENEEVSTANAEPKEENHAEEEKPEADEGDEAEEEAVLAEGEETAEADPEPTRGMNRHQTLAKRAKEAEERANKADIERAAAVAQIELIRQQRYETDTRANTIEAQRREQEALALMEPAERIAFQQNKKIHDLETRMYHTQLQSADAQDKALFHAKAAMNPNLAKHADEVEKIHQNMRAQGKTSTRDDLLYWLIGKAAAEGAGAAEKTKRAGAERRVRAASSTPPSSRSDVSSSRSSGGEDSFVSNFEKQYGNRHI